MKILSFAEISLRQRVGWKPVRVREVRMARAAQLHRVGARMWISNREQTTSLKLPIIPDDFGNLLRDSGVWGNQDAGKGESFIIVLQEEFFVISSIKQDTKKIVVELRGRTHSVSPS